MCVCNPRWTAFKGTGRTSQHLTQDRTHRIVSGMPVNWKEAQQKAALTARWAVTMAKVRIRRVVLRTRWQLVTFYGKSGGESVGVVDMLASAKTIAYQSAAFAVPTRFKPSSSKSKGAHCRKANNRRRDAVARSRKETWCM